MQDIIIGDFKSGLKRQIPGIVISGILALFLKISLNYKANATLYSGTFISNAGGWMFCWIFVFIIINVIDVIFWCISQKSLSSAWLSRLQCLPDRELFLVNILIVFLLWLPYLIITYPGSAWFDCSSSIKQIYGVLPLSNWNPIIQTFFIGGFIKFGDIIKDENFGLFLYNICQMLFSASIISYGLTCAFRRAGRMITADWTILIIIYSILPVYPLYTTSMGKDTNWSSCILLMLIILWQISGNVDWIKKKKNIILLIVSLLSICLLRNAGIYVAIACSIVAMIYSVKEYRQHVLVLSVLCMVGVVLWSQVLLPVVGVSRNGISRDSWNIQFQQMARYIKTYPDEITNEEIITINKMLSFDELSSNYNPNIVDTVTVVYYGDEISNDDLDEFKQLYWRWFRNHPGCYLDAFVAKCIGYFTPISYTSVKPFTIIGVSDVNNSVQARIPEFDLHNVNDLTYYSHYVQLLQKIPIVNLSTHCGFWTWMIFFSLFASIKRDRKAIPMIIPLLIVIIGLTIVPTNNYFRYTLSLVFATPFIMHVIYSSKGVDNDKEM